MRDRWSDEFLDAKRDVGDPDADDVVQKIFVARQIEEVDRLFATLVGSESPRPSDLPDDVVRFLVEPDPLPSGVDRERIRRGQQLFERYGPLIVIILFCSSLPRAYLARKGVQVLNLTAYLSNDPRRRVLETAQMLIDVLTPGGLERPGGFGLNAARKVRVMHAVIRFLIRNRGEWDADQLGTPINQEDLAGTLCTFSVGVIEGLERMGVSLSAAEREDYLYTWKVVGHLLGLQEEMLPRNADDGFALATRISARHFESSFEGRYLMSALTDLMKELVPWRVFDGLPSSTVRFLIGDEHANWLGVPPADWAQHLVRGLRVTASAFDRWTDTSSAHRRIGQIFGGAVVRGLLEMERGPKRMPLRIPPELGWRVGRKREHGPRRRRLRGSMTRRS